MRVAVAGGTGVVGRYVASGLRAAGHEAVVLARSRGIDLRTGRAVADALSSVQAVVDVSNTRAAGRRAAAEFFTAATRQLLETGRRAGVGHHVVLSIVGVDRVPGGYYAGKLAQEELVLGEPVPATVLRATQFHEFAGQVLARSRGPLAPVPRMRIRPIGAAEVAQSLVALAVGEPVGRAPELAGPAEDELVDLARRVLVARASRRRVVPLRLPGPAGRLLAAGALLPTSGGPRGVQTFDDWLATQHVEVASPDQPEQPER